jgi:hypothetical protein
VDSDDNKERDEAPEKREYVNSEILSLTTQTDLGELSPPLNLTFHHTKKVFIPCLMCQVPMRIIYALKLYFFTYTAQ